LAVTHFFVSKRLLLQYFFSAIVENNDKHFIRFKSFYWRKHSTCRESVFMMLNILDMLCS